MTEHATPHADVNAVHVVRVRKGAETINDSTTTCSAPPTMVEPIVEIKIEIPSAL
jgi:hypothetical protein